MSAYIIFFREGPVQEPAELQEYNRKAQEGRPEPRPKLVCLYPPITPLEGDPPDGVVVLQFPTIDDAKAWYHSPAYQAALPHRHAAAPYRVIIVEGA